MFAILCYRRLRPRVDQGLPERVICRVHARASARRGNCFQPSLSSYRSRLFSAVGIKVFIDIEFMEFEPYPDALLPAK